MNEDTQKERPDLQQVNLGNTPGWGRGNQDSI